MSHSPPRLTRRAVLLATAALLSASGVASARDYRGHQPWQPFADIPQEPVRPGPWLYFTADEAVTIEAMVDRLVPPDHHGIGGKDAGCAVYIDRQLAGPYGRAEGLYMRPPFVKASPLFGIQSAEVPAAQYRSALAALDKYLRAQPGAKPFAELPQAAQVDTLKAMEAGKLALGDVDAKSFFELLLSDTMDGFFADPIYGGNKDMASWRMIGFPGTRYDYRPYLKQMGTRIKLEPISLQGNAGWNRKG